MSAELQELRGKVTVVGVCAATGRHDLPGVGGTYSEVTIAMEE
ncbi:hypothetical protein ACFWJY_39180 [Streptomyces anulatus]